MNQNKLVGNYGHKARNQKRESKRNKIIARTNELINSTFDELKKQKDEINHEIYEKELANFFDKIQKEIFIKSDLKVAYKQLADFLIEGNKKGKWNLKIPVTEVRYTEPLSFRNDQWFIQSSQLNQWNQSWLNHLDLTDSCVFKYQESQLLASVLISAALYGGLCVPEELVAFANILRKEESKIFYQKDYIWIDLIYESPDRANNLVVNDEEKCYRKWYPDLITLFWIHNYLNFQFKNERSFKLFDQDSLWKLIYTYLTHIDNSSITKIDTLKKFCLASIGVTENSPGVDLNFTLSDYCVGKISSSSLKSNFHILNDIQSNPLSTNQSVSYHKNFFTSFCKSSQKRSFNRDISEAKKDIIHCVRIFIDKSRQRKNTNQNAIKDLNELMRETRHNPELIIISWLKYKLEIDKNKVSSVNTYRSRICSKWLDATINTDVLNIEPKELEKIYKSILSQSKNRKSRIDTTRILNLFHTYAVQNYGFPSVISFNKSSNQKYSFVRAGFIPENLYVDLCNSICKISDIDEFTQEAIKCITIITYRTGLRISEILKLKLNDIEKSKMQWTYIRENEFGNVKNYSSLRKVPLQILLTSHELEIINNYLMRKKALVSYQFNKLVFTESGYPDNLLEKEKVSGLVKSILFEITGLNFVFHDLRHTALSKLQIILENNETLIRNLTGYSEKEVSEIQRFFLGEINTTKKDKYWAISGLAGHITPETTFTHYLHFNDVIVGDKLKASKRLLSLNSIINISGLSSRILAREINKHIIDNDSIPINILSDLLIRKIKPLTNQIQQTTIKKPFKIIQSKNKGINFETYWSILNDAENGVQAQVLSYKYNLSELDIHKLIESARQISNIHSTKNKSRLFTKRQRDNPVNEYLAPRKPASRIEFDEIKRVMIFIQNNYIKHQKLIDYSIDYFINNKVSSHNYLVFSSTKTFKKYIKLLFILLSNDRILIRLEVKKLQNIEKQLEIWKPTTSRGYTFLKCNVTIKENFQIDKSKYPNGKLSLKVLHPTKNNKGTNTIAFVFHILAILNNADL